MILETLEVGPLGCTCVVVGDPQSGQAVVVDPGDEAPAILDVLKRHGLHVTAVLLTHAHIDHVGAVAKVCQATGAPVLLHHDDQPVLQTLEVQARLVGLPVPERFLTQPLVTGSVHRVGALGLRVIHTPGHTMGSCSLFLEEERVLLSGDTLFREGVGRTDLGGNWGALVRSIRERVFTLGDDVKVIPGHGPPTTVGHERAHNPFLP
jgi:glyoxylase-like metal-dependent hydrolase (beta-lactamase superfamily II)